MTMHLLPSFFRFRDVVVRDRMMLGRFALGQEKLDWLEAERQIDEPRES